jgi:oxygen-independent coproporphyrinogen III oxidase
LTVGESGPAAPDPAPAPPDPGRATPNPGPATPDLRPTTEHLYIHVPFCRSCCAYCDFTSEPVGPHRRAGRVRDYLDALRAEFRLRLPLLATALQTVYLGGGTPTALTTDELCGVFGLAGGLLAPGGELTVEAEPADVDADLLTRLQAAGVTRLSLGVQSFSPALRTNLGRRTTQPALDHALAALADCGWAEWNLDLVFAIPGQDWQSLAADLDAAVAAGPPHISLYDLTYTSAYARTVERRLGAEALDATADFAEAHYREAVDRLEAAGYERYEVSNFARPGHESRHNMAYWRGEDYVGLGAGAVSTVGDRRWTNPSTVAAYVAGEAPTVELLDPATRRFERAMLGLRMRAGVDEQATSDSLDPDALDRLVASGYVERACATLRLTASGLDLSNTVLSQLLRFPDQQGSGRR